MARITVEDCIERINNRFELVLLATKRARQIARGGAALLDEENDKPTVIALREIAEGKVDAEFMSLQESRGLLAPPEIDADHRGPRMPGPPTLLGD